MNKRIYILKLRMNETRVNSSKKISRKFNDLKKNLKYVIRLTKI